MKNNILILFSFLFFTFISCSKESQIIINQTENDMQSGTWKIIYFIDSGDDEVSKFNGYNFTFSSEGLLTAANGTNSFAGTWSVTDDGSNDDSQSDLHFNISFNLTNDFEDLNDDWEIVLQSSDKLELIDISGGNGGTDYLTFEKK
jgi:hypothetical protein